MENNENNDFSMESDINHAKNLFKMREEIPSSQKGIYERMEEEQEREFQAAIARERSGIAWFNDSKKDSSEVTSTSSSYNTYTASIDPIENLVKDGVLYTGTSVTLSSPTFSIEEPSLELNEKTDKQSFDSIFDKNITPKQKEPLIKQGIFSDNKKERPDPLSKYVPKPRKSLYGEPSSLKERIYGIPKSLQSKDLMSDEELREAELSKKKSLLEQNVSFNIRELGKYGVPLTLSKLQQWIGTTEINKIIEETAKGMAPEPVNNDEEIVINYNELADTLSKNAIKAIHKDFFPDIHLNLYNRFMGEYLSVILQHKRNNND